MPLLYVNGSEIFVISVSTGFHRFLRHVLPVSPTSVTLTGTKDIAINHTFLDQRVPSGMPDAIRICTKV